MTLIFALLILIFSLPARAQNPSALESLEAQAGISIGSIRLGRLNGFPSALLLPSSYNVGTTRLEAPLTEIPLAPLLDADRYTSASFMAGNVRVHVFGTKSENKDKWFLEFWPENSPEPIFVKGINLLHYHLAFIQIMDNTFHLVVNRHSYRVYIKGQIRNEMESRLIIAPDDRGEKKTIFTIKQLVRGAYETGYPVAIGGKNYRVVYSRGFIESDDGRFERYGPDRAIIFLSLEEGAAGGFHVLENDIPHGGPDALISTPSLSRQNSKDHPDGTTVGLQIDAADNLQVYYPVRP